MKENRGGNRFQFPSRAHPFDNTARPRAPVLVDDPDRMRPLDTPDLAGDASLIASTCGWKPEIPLDETWDRILAWVRDEPYGEAW